MRRREIGGRRAEATGTDAVAVIRTGALTKKYGDLVAVDRLNIEVRSGEIFGLLGPNGAGKTTTILMLLGLSEPTDGRAEVVGHDPTREPIEVKRLVGYVPDEVGFYGGLTGRQNLRYTGRLNGLDRRAAEERIDSLLGQVGLADVADRRVDTYSRGMRQRLGLADALVKDPRVLILDEPTTAIDPAGVIQILDLIRSLAKDRGTAVLLSSHLLHQVQSICDRVAIFVAGRIIAQGTTARLAEQFAGKDLELEVGVDGPADRVEQVLRAISGVRDVTPDPHDPRMRRVTGDRDLRTRIASDIAAGGLTLWHLRRTGDDLDTIYTRYFTQEAGDDGRAA